MPKLPCGEPNIGTGGWLPVKWEGRPGGGGGRLLEFCIPPEPGYG